MFCFIKKMSFETQPIELNDGSDDFSIGYVFKNRYRIVEILTPGGQARVFVIEDINCENKK